MREVVPKIERHNRLYEILRAKQLAYEIPESMKGEVDDVITLAMVELQAPDKIHPEIPGQVSPETLKKLRKLYKYLMKSKSI